MSDRVTQLEELLAHQQRMLDELNGVVIELRTQLDRATAEQARLKKTVQRLLEQYEGAEGAPTRSRRIIRPGFRAPGLGFTPFRSPEPVIMPRTRLAPSPTGALHLGNARTFLINWALARQNGWDILLRIEDLDGPRIKPHAAEHAVETLRWLGLDWDEGPTFQSHDLKPYQAALDKLAQRGDVYPCRCTRTQIAADSLSAPHGDAHELRYSGRCRPPEPKQFERCDPAAGAWRVRVPEGLQAFQDAFFGEESFDIDQQVGDFLVATKGGSPSYQLAVVVDDARQRIDQVVRGDDLLSSAPRQELLYRKLGLGPPPTWTHVPLVKGPDGRRLAKRHGDTRVDSYRSAGVAPERLIGLLADWSGLGPRAPMSVAEFRDAFRQETLPRDAVTFTPQDDAWLHGAD